MSSIKLVLDPGPFGDPGPDDHCVAGTQLGGRIECHCNAPLECRGLRVVLTWHLKSPGDGVGETVYAKTLHKGLLPAGTTSFPFSVLLPSKPITYSGSEISIHWIVGAELDVPGDARQQAVRRVIIVPPVVPDVAG